VTRSILALAASAAGCRGELAPMCEDGSCGTQTSSRKTFQMPVNARLDLLFVIDDTNEVAPHLSVLATGFADIVRPADRCFEAASNFTIECLGCTDANDPACAVLP
jgi:hypothetical protein